MAPTVLENFSDEQSRLEHIKNRSSSVISYVTKRHKTCDSPAQILAILKKVKKSIPDIILNSNICLTEDEITSYTRCNNKTPKKILSDRDSQQRLLLPAKINDSNNITDIWKEDIDDAENCSSYSPLSISRSSTPLPSPTMEDQHQQLYKMPPSPQWSVAIPSPSTPSTISEPPSTPGAQPNFLALALRTIRLLKRNRALQFKVAQLKEEANYSSSTAMSSQYRQ